MEMLGLPSQEGGGIGDELMASEEALRFGWAGWAIHGHVKKLTDCGDVLALVIPRSQRGSRGFESPLVHHLCKNLHYF